MRQYKLAGELGQYLEGVKARAEALARYREAAAVLEKAPADPAANLAAGKHLCFLRDDWKRGVAMLALGSDGPLQAQAAKDLEGAKTPDEMVALGDGWWGLAERCKGQEKDALMRRAVHWYRQAQGQLASGLTKTKVEQRLLEAAPLRLKWLEADLRVTPAGAVIPGRWVDLLEIAALPRDRVQGEWSRAGEAWVARQRSSLALPVRVEGSYDLEVEFTRVQGNDTVGVQVPVGIATCNMFLSAWGGSVHGLSNVDGRDAGDNVTTVRPGTLANGQRYRLLLEVRVEGEDAAITAMLDGERLVAWSGKQKSLTPFEKWDRPWQPVLAIAAGEAHFHAARFRLVAGRAALVQ